MKSINHDKVSYFNLALGYFLFLVAALMSMVMDTAKDRSNYIIMFAQPFGNSRIEIGFQYYMEAFALIGIPPDVAIVITCVFIYMLMAWVWFAWIRLNWIESILLFNFFIFSLFNYYLGTSIRMGLATALALYASTRIVRGNKKFWGVLWLSSLLHYGVVPFVLTVTWVFATRKLSWRLHKAFIVLACIALPLSVGLILQWLGLSGYYMAYFNSNQGGTERIFPFTYAFFLLALLLSSFKGSDAILRRIAFYGLPFLLYGMFSGVELFSKMLIPNIFISAIVITHDYRDFYAKNIGSDLRFYVSVALNGLAMIYALRAYQYI